MMSSISLQQFQFARSGTLGLLKGINETKWDEQPIGFPNNIRWNAGHIFVSAEFFLHQADEEYEMKHGDWAGLFATGTKPADWSNNIPSASDIISALEEQAKRVEAHFRDKTVNSASKSVTIGPLEMNTVDALVQFNTFHEGNHIGIIKSLNNVLK